MRSEIASVVTHIRGYGNAIVDGREKNQWLKSDIDHYCRGFSEQYRLHIDILGRMFRLVQLQAMHDAMSVAKAISERANEKDHQ